LASLQTKLNSSAQINAGFATDDDAIRFFSQLPKTYIERLYDYYMVDFGMFGYDYPQEFIDLGIDDRQESESVDDVTEVAGDSEDYAGADLVDEEEDNT